MSLLEVEGLTKRFGGLTAVDEVTFTVEERRIFSIIGPNGAGKSTLFKLITAFLRPTAGRVRLAGEEISGQSPHAVARRGVVRTFQETTIFREMTALDNVVVAHHLQGDATLAGFFFGSRRARASEAAFRESAREILDYLGLGEVADETARNLPHGYLRALGIAIAMAASPRVVLLDEPFAGMNPEETNRAMDMVRGIRGPGGHRAPRRARHARRHADQRPSAGAQLRTQDCGGGAGRDPARRARHRSLSRATGGRAGGRLGSGGGRGRTGFGRGGPGVSYFRAADLSVRYDQVRAITDVSVELGEGDIVALIGANGAGKTTTLRAITGLARLAAGEIILDGQRIDGLRPDEIVALGVAMVPEGRRVFPFLSVMDNLLMGAFLRRGRREIAADVERVFERFPRLRERRGQAAGTMSGGEQQMLAIGRALMARPRLLLLDEPSLGLAPMLVQEIARSILAINREDRVSLILVEQNSRMALRVSSRAYALETGRVALEGRSRDLVNDDRIRELYLGG